MGRFSLKKVFSGSDGKKYAGLIVLAVLGFALVIFGTSRSAKSDEKTKFSKEDATSEYIEMLENKIRNITEQITGDGNAAVIITVKSGVESVYVCDEKYSGDEKNIEYITVKDSGGGGSLVLVKVIYPEVEGATVACADGENPTVKAKLLCAVSTALGIPTNHICIIGKK